MAKLVYKYSQLGNDIISYEQSLKMCKGHRKIHLGQLKLFFTELLFLTFYAKPGCHILYVGAAEGYHTSKLADMFPDCQFDLWDPREFETEPRTNIKIYQQYFTDDTAQTYRNLSQPLLFMCDLRNLGIGRAKTNKNISKMDEITDDDMAMQARWCKIFKPFAAYLKFRLPYEVAYSEYLTGTIYLQPYTKISTESRLLTCDYESVKIYDNNLFNEKMAYHNAYNRCLTKEYPTWQHIMYKYNLYSCWDTAYALRITHNYLKYQKNIISKKETGRLFMEIISFHIKKYGNKYSVLFNNNIIPANIGDHQND